ncbi:phosphatidate cytidylyltransferase [Opitutus sp. GAS368]|uniref:phosphatidate cytidylyltransferase n=1 Tax=Opitutus sp. GAS368 TaxID=1882749 RepID=UPI00087BC562|nr:phosphatidate cytidylyltransferase [Opitutus sp. GAS368]SDS39192.1 phosphatidate cytidylyltransferase [Opitutus sp. GAS368]
MLSRILSTVILWVVILGSLYFGGAHAAVALLALLAALTLHEFYGLTAKMGARPFRWMGLGFALLMVAGPYYLAYFTEEPEVLDLAANLATGLLVLALVVSCIRVLGERNTASRVETIAATVGGLLYIPYLLHFLVRILMRDADSGENLALCLWVVAVSKFCDVGALLTGLALGRHKLAPEISPKKTWEGAVGGVLVAAGVGAAIAFFASARLPESLTPPIAAAIAVPLAVIAIISDLIESAIKRRADTKDTGHLIPGIGGAFDLTDSLLLTAPVAYFIFLFVN